MASGELLVRPAGDADLVEVAAIFAHYVEHSLVTFELDPPGLATWRDRHRALTEAGWPFLVGEVMGVVVGYAYVGPWRPRPAYRHTVEDSIYLHPEHRGHGHGRGLLFRLLQQAAAAGARQVLAVIADTGDGASTALHRAAGFRPAGRLEDVGLKHGRWLAVQLMQATLQPAPARAIDVHLRPEAGSA